MTPAHSPSEYELFLAQQAARVLAAAQNTWTEDAWLAQSRERLHAQQDAPQHGCRWLVIAILTSLFLWAVVIALAIRLVEVFRA